MKTLFYFNSSSKLSFKVGFQNRLSSTKPFSSPLCLKTKQKCLFSTSKNSQGLDSYFSFFEEDLEPKDLEKNASEFLKDIRKRLDKQNLFHKFQELEKQINQDNFWTATKSPNLIMKEFSKIKSIKDLLETNERDFKDFIELKKICGDDKELVFESSQLIQKIHISLKQLDFRTLLKSNEDTEGCFLEIQAGAGGTESMDWVSMLLRMYTRWAESHSHSIEIVDQVFGEVAGIKSVTIKVGEALSNTYGWLKSESGIHRLIRISPFDANNRRHTSFASVFVFPLVAQNEFSIDEKDLKIETFRSSGPGGQHVNKTESAVRITHIPTGISSQSQNERSQHRNKSMAMEVLTSRLNELEKKKKILEFQNSKSEIGENTWGNQIRTYTLHPYQIIKDNRFGTECTNTDDFLNGGKSLDLFLFSAMRQRSV